MPDINLQTSIEGWNPFVLTTAAQSLLASPGGAASLNVGTTAGTVAAGDHTHPGGSEAFPVGAVFIAVVSTNPGTLLGYGTWSAFGAGRVLVGLDAGQAEFDVVEETGGAKTHTLATTEIPAHTHTQDAHNHTQDAHSHTYGSQTATTGAATSYEHGVVDTSSAITNEGGVTNTAVATNQNATATNQNTGGGGAHNNLQPYIVVYMFKRTA